MATFAALIGRVLLAAYYIVTGVFMVLAPGSAEASLTGAGFVPGAAQPMGAVLALCGLCLAVGALTRLMAVLLALWTVLAIAVVHPAGMIAVPLPEMLMQAGMIGGLLLVYAHSQMWWSWDAMRRERRVLRDERNAVLHDRDAELSAARADGAAATDAPVRRRWF